MATTNKMGDLSIAIHNIRSIQKNKTELKQFLTEHNTDIIALNETFKTVPKFISTPEHKYIISKPAAHIGKGVAHMHKSTLQITDLPEITSASKTNINHSILLTTIGTTIQISTIYCPRGNPDSELITKIIDRNVLTIITGDFNVKHENIGYEEANAAGRRLFDLMERNRFTLINTPEPNHTNQTTGNLTIKSLIFVSTALMNLFREFTVSPDNLGSDHNICTATFQINPAIITIPTKTIHLYHLADWDSINQTIKQLMHPHQLTHQSSCEDIDNHVEHLSTNILKVITEEVPTKTINHKRPGLPKNVRELIREKKHYRRKYQRTRLPMYKEKYNQLTNSIKKHMKIHHDIAWQTTCNDMELADQQHSSWNKITRIMGTNNKPVTIPTLITEDVNGKKKHHYTTEEKVNVLEETITDVFQTKNDRTDPKYMEEVERTLANHQHLLTPREDVPANFLNHRDTIPKDKIKRTIERSKTKKAAGPDKITPKMLQHILPGILNILFILFNLCAFKGYHSKHWKQPLSILLNKPNKIKSNPINYRIIQLINIIGKTLEKLQSQHLYHYATTFQHINPEQAAYQFFKGCNDKIFQAAQTTFQAYHKHQFCSTVFMDVEKAFDKVSHSILLHILITRKFPVKLIRFIASFLSNRSTYFTINGITSGFIDMLLGVPQGSCLSALLFIIYFAYIPTPEHLEQDPSKCIKPHQKLNKPAILTQFADDIKTLNAGKKLEKVRKNIQHSLNEIDKFTKQRESKLNAKKTKELITTAKSTKFIKDIPPLTLNNIPIETVTFSRFLGIIFDKRASFKIHVNDVAARTQHRLIRLKQTVKHNYGPCKTTAIRLYKIYVRSMFDYGPTALIVVDEKIIKKWEIIQTKILRHILGAHYLSNENVLKFANVPTIKERITFLAANWYQQVINSNNEPVLDFIKYEVYPKYDHAPETPYHLIKQAHADWEKQLT